MNITVTFLIFLALGSFSFAKEIPLNTKTIGLYKSDIEITKHIFSIFERYEFKDFDIKKIKHLKRKFKVNLIYQRYQTALELISDVNTLKNDKNILRACKNFSELPVDVDVKYRFAIYCFHKTFNPKMSQKDFERLEEATSLAFENSRVRRKARRYRKSKTPDKTAKVIVRPSSVDHQFLRLIRKIRRLSHSSKKHSKRFDKLISTFYSKMLSKDMLKATKHVQHVKYLVRTLNRHGVVDEARKISKFAVLNTEQFQDSFYFELLWSYISRSDYENAYKLVVKKFNLEQGHQKFDNLKLSFWVAHTLQQNKVAGFKEIYQYIVGRNAIDYYAILSHNRIKELSEDEPVALVQTKSGDLSKESFELSRVSIQRLSFIRALVHHNSIFLLSDQVSKLIEDNINYNADKKEKFYLSLASFMQENENYLESFKILYRGINREIVKVDDRVLRLLYPKPYLGLIADQEKDFESYLALSLMRQESSFNNKASSRVGALGLMQLMPNTARGMKKNVKMSQLFDPRVNIKLGVQYLNGLNKKYDKNFVHTLSAYNAGERNLRRWKKRYFTSDSTLKNIENIPFLETRKYVQLIFRNVFYYNYIDKLDGRQPATDTNALFEKYLGIKH